jgi:hypothetical protein
MQVLIAGGGPGGHLYPGIALAREFERLVPGTQVVFVGTAKGFEAKIIPQQGYEIRMIKIRGLIGMGITGKLLALLELPYSLYQSFRLLCQIRPSLVIGVGGYASGPVVLMAGFFAFPECWLSRMPLRDGPTGSYRRWFTESLCHLRRRVVTLKTPFECEYTEILFERKSKTALRIGKNVPPRGPFW